MTELYTVNEQGQLEVNFDSLELITNAEFVKAVKKELNDYQLEVISINDGVRIVEVIITDKYDSEVSIFKYYKNLNTFDSVHISKRLLSSIQNILVEKGYDE